MDFGIVIALDLTLHDHCPLGPEPPPVGLRAGIGTEEVERAAGGDRQRLPGHHMQARALERVRAGERQAASHQERVAVEEAQVGQRAVATALERHSRPGPGSARERNASGAERAARGDPERTLRAEADGGGPGLEGEAAGEGHFAGTERANA